MDMGYGIWATASTAEAFDHRFTAQDETNRYTWRSSILASSRIRRFLTEVCFVVPVISMPNSQRQRVAGARLGAQRKGD